MCWSLVATCILQCRVVVLGTQRGRRDWVWSAYHCQKNQHTQSTRILVLFHTTTTMMNTSLSKVAMAMRRPGVRQMSSTAKVWVDKNTRVICQGFTGKQVCRLCVCRRHGMMLAIFVPQRRLEYHEAAMNNVQSCSHHKVFFCRLLSAPSYTVVCFSFMCVGNISLETSD